MKIRIRPDDTSMLQMNDWLAELRDDGRDEPPGDGDEVPAADDARPEAPAVHAVPAERTVPIERTVPAPATVRAVIGDQLRMPVMWCEMGSCISWHADPAALGEGDARVRAIGAGWRIDAFGRLACPQCQQTDPGFRASRPVVRWDRYTAIARAARITAAAPASLRSLRWHPGSQRAQMGGLMVQEYAGDPFPSQWHHAGARISLSCRDEIDRTAMAASLSRLEGWVGGRWLMLAAEMAGLADGGRRPSPDPVSAGQVRLPRIATRTLGADAGSVRSARDFTTATLHRWGTAERSQDIAIVVSELLTNALRHALPGSGDTRPRRPIRLGLLQPGLCVLCAVADPSRAAPAPRAPGSLAETGRGLNIICALSDQWGYGPSDPGKVVWAMFYLRLTVCGPRG